MAKYVVKEADFKSSSYGTESYLSNWPMLYILENGHRAYIGQSNHVRTRMAEHLNNKEKRIFEKVHFIYSSKFNQSVTLDYEAKLIQYTGLHYHYSSSCAGDNADPIPLAEAKGYLDPCGKCAY